MDFLEDYFLMLIVGAILLCGRVLSYFLFRRFIGGEASVFIGAVMSAYPAFLASTKIDFDG